MARVGLCAQLAAAFALACGLCGCLPVTELPNPGNPGGSPGPSPVPSLAGYIYRDSALDEYVLCSARNTSLVPIKGIIIRALDSSGTSRQTSTDIAGYWQLFGVAPGEATLTVLTADGRQITSRPAIVPEEQTLFWPSPAVRVRLSTEQPPSSGDSSDAPQPTLVRRVRITEWSSDFRLSARALAASLREEQEPVEEPPLTAVVKIEFYGEGENARVVVKVQVHNSFEAWAVSSEVVAVDDVLEGYFEPSSVNIAPGGYTTVFAGSVLDDTFRVGEIEEAVLPGVSYLRIVAPGGIATATRIEGEVHARSESGRTLIGTFAGAVEM